MRGLLVVLGEGAEALFVSEVPAPAHVKSSRGTTAGRSLNELRSRNSELLVAGSGSWSWSPAMARGSVAYAAGGLSLGTDSSCNTLGTSVEAGRASSTVAEPAELQR
mmetsp:Transcript_68805/g.213426  ORF Transcript_68805/g.213426 Transcript_68805/m.213426 type:complete len:107 (-) Transcript_68805:629-949(-)